MLTALRPLASLHREPISYSFASHAGDTFRTTSLVQTALPLCGQAVTLTHGDRSLSGGHIGVMYDLVYDGVADRAVLDEIGMDSLMPIILILLGIKLSKTTSFHRIVSAQQK